MYILVGMLVIGLICNLMVRPVADKWFMTDTELAEERRLAHEKSVAAEASLARGSAGHDATPAIKIALAWAAVVIPLIWGVYKAMVATSKFFD